jgi:hypothetical protein
MFDLNQILAQIFDALKFSPKTYSALAILGSVLLLLVMNPSWIPFAVSDAALKFIGTLATALLALTGSRTTSYLKPPTVKEEMAQVKPAFGVN